LGWVQVRGWGKVLRCELELAPVWTKLKYNAVDENIAFNSSSLLFFLPSFLFFLFPPFFFLKNQTQILHKDQS
jgi:hypothetical protein